MKMTVKTEYQHKLLRWIEGLSEANKKVSHLRTNYPKGLRVIKKVIELQGAKKLKLSDKSRNLQMHTTNDAKHASLEQA